MMPIGARIILTVVLSFFTTWIAAFPSSKFSYWGAIKFGDYQSFLWAIVVVHAIPLIILLLYFIWTH